MSHTIRDAVHRRPSGSSAVEGSSRSHTIRRDLGVAVIVLAGYFVLSLLASPYAHLSTDVGGKSGAVEAMLVRDDWSTDLGYWAEDADPAGVAYPFSGTTKMPNGWWVNTTSIPMVLAARPLWDLGGPQLALLLPMLGSVGAALSAAALERRWLGGGSGRRSFWIVAATTPAAVYALDFWEHSIGLGLMVLGLVWITDAEAEDAWLPAFGAGLAFGLAAVMRQEALVYGVVAGAALSMWQLTSLRSDQRLGLPLTINRIIRGSAPPVAMAFGSLGMLAANAAIETRYYGASFRSSRNAGTAAQLGDGLADRARAAFATLLSPVNAFHPVSYLLGTTLLVGLVWLGFAVARRQPLRMPALVSGAVFTLMALRIASTGPTFVPGLVPTAPLAAVGAVLAFSARRWPPIVFGLVPLPLIWLVQFANGALPQWGGRYILLTGLVLVVAACVHLPSLDQRVFAGLAAAGLAITGCGVWWTVIRTHSLEDDWELIERVAEGDVVVWFDPVKAREAGAVAVDQRWLSTVGDTERQTVEAVLDAEGVDRFVYLDGIDADVVEFAGFREVSDVGEWRTSVILQQRLTVFERE